MYQGVVAELLGWRWIFWGSSILGFVFLLSTIFLLPETLPRSYQPATPQTIEEDKKWSLLMIIRFVFTLD
jgi:predicted MFS family arabinose efflux permease